MQAFDILIVAMSLEDNLLFPEDQERERRSNIYGTREFWQAYQDHIQSPAWKKLRREVRERAKNRCERCPPIVHSTRLEVHHKTYERFRRELLSDLELLCPTCHRIADAERERRNQQAYETAGQEAREAAWKNSYFTTKYGEHWWSLFHGDPEGANAEFDEWRQRKFEEGDPRYEN